jgi:ABC transporter substrate binding protein
VGPTRPVSGAAGRSALLWNRTNTLRRFLTRSSPRPHAPFATQQIVCLHAMRFRPDTLMPRLVAAMRGSNEAAGLHWVSWRRGCVAARRARAATRIRRIGVLAALVEDDPEVQARIGAFLQGLQQLGWTGGRNVQIEYRWAGGSVDDIRKYAAELVALRPDVVLSTGGASLAALLQATRTMPIVFTNVPDPVGAGFVDSLARPGGNATGFVVFEFSLTGNGWNYSNRSRQA